MLIFPGFICAVIGLEALTGSFAVLSDTIFSERLGATFQYTNTACIYFSICLIFAMALMNNSKNDFGAAIISGIGNIFAFALFMTGSRGAYLAGMAALLLFIFLQPSGLRLRGAVRLSVVLVPLVFTIGKFNIALDQGGYIQPTLWLAISFLSASLLSLMLSLIKVIIRKSPLGRVKPVMPKHSGVISAVVFVIIVAAAVIFRDNIFSMMPEVLSSRLKNLNFNDANILFRLEFDRDALKLIKDNWLTGLGGGGWETVYRSVQEVNYIANYIHNNFLQVFVESGITGFLAYTFLLAVTFVNLVISLFREGSKTIKVYITGFLCGFIALVVHSSFDFDLSYYSLILILFTMISVSAVTRKNSVAVDLKEESVYNKANSSKLAGKVKIASVITCAALFSTYALFFTAAYNGHKGLIYIDEKRYDDAIVYFEEASRLDKNNSEYSFQLSKLYYNKAIKSNDERDKLSCLEKARIAGEKGANENRYHPVQQKLLLQIYQGLDMPMEAVECAERLVQYQRSNRRNYELLAESYIAAAEFMKENNDIQRASELLDLCLELKENKYCSGGTAYFFDMMGKKSGYSEVNNKILTSYFNEAEQLLSEIK
jgi:O-antigen ligase